VAPQAILPWALFLFGVGFLGANLKLVRDLIWFRRRRASALLIWEGEKPKYYGFMLGLGVVLGLLLVFRIFVQRRGLAQLFGEAMMFVYYAYVFPLSTRIAKGFYQDGVWADTGFMPWDQISAVSWKEEGRVTLVLISQLRSIARRLTVPGPLYGQARRVLRDRVRAHDIRIGGAGLDLGSREEQDAV